VVLGIGINVNNTELPVELKSIASSLRIEAGRVISRPQVLASLLHELDRNYQLLLKDGAAAILQQWAAASSFACGKRIRVVKATGEMLATTAGLDSSGGLRIRSDDGREESLVAGELVEVK
jgi:BirA family biotin operon repressor/biotin-[acetyl-CoA-carboxylase] ligase